MTARPKAHGQGGQQAGNRAQGLTLVGLSVPRATAQPRMNGAARVTWWRDRSRRTFSPDLTPTAVLKDSPQRPSAIYRAAGLGRVSHLPARTALPLGMRYAYGSHATRAGPQREQCSHAAVSTRKGEAATRQAGYEVAFAQERSLPQGGSPSASRHATGQALDAWTAMAKRAVRGFEAWVRRTGHALLPHDRVCHPRMSRHRPGKPGVLGEPIRH
jgi:hypothetical protein